MTGLCRASIFTLLWLTTCGVRRTVAIKTDTHKGPWYPGDVPNPSIDYQRCNILGPGALCDPDAYLTSGGRLNVLDALTAIRQKTNVTCPDHEDHGYQLAVLVISRMHPNAWVGHSKDATAAKFAEDRYAYIKTTANSRRALPDEQAGYVIDNMKPLLRDADYDSAVLQATLQIYDVLMGKRLKAKAESDELPAWVTCLIIVAVFIVVFLAATPTAAVALAFGFIMLFVYPIAALLDFCCAKRRSPPQNLGTATEDLQRVQRELERPDFEETLCAICLEALDGPLQTSRLGCRHTFHLECIEPWLSSHHACPLCRSPEDVPEEPLDEDAVERTDGYRRKLRFYLSRLRQRHPTAFEGEGAHYYRSSHTGLWEFQRYRRPGFYDLWYHPYYADDRLFRERCMHSNYGTQLQQHLAEVRRGANSWAEATEAAARAETQAVAAMAVAALGALAAEVASAAAAGAEAAGEGASPQLGDP
eukprot:CAMPEP_0171143812 /NCGR_PEP_ID=MMETSP0766_2-20121228/144902_1 /TAXON_ID=439317 /ORGANISM="Gambierdiscus australes, Strain CAWD 149" /LENGTH=474 /DNA_ID=CAMNT_0011607645 /DNA_START=19 /DNA_END=1440 /DNA_ORIENTATION=-